MHWYKPDRRYALMYLKLLCLSLLYVFPLILADIYYQDDLARSYYGATGWNGDGRPLGEALIVWLCGGGRTPIADTSPLPMILSVMILAYVLILYAKTNWNLASDDYMQIAVLLFILVNPFAIANLSYRYDCIIMFTALSISFLMYSLPDTIPGAAMVLISAVLGMSVMSLYQPAISMCILLFIAHIFLFVIGKKEKISIELYRIIGAGLGAVLYELVVAPHYIGADEGDWRQNAARIVGHSLQDIKLVCHNVLKTCRYITDNIMGTSWVNTAVIGVLIVFALTAAVRLFYIESRQQRVRKIIGIIFIIFSPLAAFFATFCPLMLLQVLELRGRIFISFGGFMFFIGVMMLFSVKKYRVLGTILCAICILYQYTFMYSYANALKSQNEYQKYMVYNVAHDLETINCDKDYSAVTIIGTMPRAKQSQLICDKYPLIDELVPVYIDNSPWLGGVWLYSYLQQGLTLEAENDSDLQYINDGEPILKNSVYSCYVKSDKIIVWFREE